MENFEPNSNRFIPVCNNCSPHWIGFGISEAGHILGADIVTVIHNPVNGEVIVEDRCVPWEATPLTESPLPYPILDEIQD